jgi:hypothetical protein
LDEEEAMDFATSRTCAMKKPARGLSTTPGKGVGIDGTDEFEAPVTVGLPVRTSLLRILAIRRDPRSVAA